MITRRTLIAGAASVAPLAALPAIPLAAASPERAPPTLDELRRYYAFLWSEFRSVADELGVDMHDADVFQLGGGKDAVQQMTGDSLPSTRARVVMRAAQRATA
ncbi:hypothetical protein [Ancylobacter terrae]|uniref:hypothetical protein n=1 Tax=Ancylobacter sp. sgz301288 TaxID=3342077 RepID=UPI00385E702A